jgi:hypothetical protein
MQKAPLLGLFVFLGQMKKGQSAPLSEMNE